MTYIGVKFGSRFVGWKSDDSMFIKPSCIAPQLSATGKVLSYEPFNPQNIQSKYPLSRGIISSQEEFTLLTELMKFLTIPQHAKMVVASPEASQQDGRELLKKAVIQTFQPSDLILFPESFCGAVSLLGPDYCLNNFISVLNLGSTTTGIGLFSPLEDRDPILLSFPQVSGVMTDLEITNSIINTYGKPVINDQISCSLKESFHFESPPTCNVTIRTTGSSTKSVSCQKEVLDALKKYSSSVSNIFLRSYYDAPPDIAHNMISSPLIFTGGMSKIPGLCQLILSEINKRASSTLNTFIVKDGNFSPAEGAYLLSKEYFG